MRDQCLDRYQACNKQNLGSKTFITTLTKLEKLQNIVEPPKASVNKGQNVTFTCNSDVPVAWEKKKGYLEDNIIASHTEKEHQISIINVRRRNEGKYVCKSESDYMIYAGHAILKVKCKLSGKVESYNSEKF